MLLEHSETAVDGKSEIRITHTKRRKYLELIFFLFWTLVGTFLIAMGAILVTQSLFFRIPLIIIGGGVIMLFFESLISKITNKIILNENEIRTRFYIKWRSLPWEKVSSIEVEKRVQGRFRARDPLRAIGLEIHSQELGSIIYPLRSFSQKESEKIVEIVEDYFRANRRIETAEKVLVKAKNSKEFILLVPEDDTEESELSSSLKSEDSEDLTNIAISPRVDESEIDDS